MEILQRTSQGDPAQDLLQRSSQRELAESDLVSLLFKGRSCPASLQPLMILDPFHVSVS